MAMFAPIPLPSADNPQFKDVMDYLETIRQRKAQQQEAEQKLAESQRQFGITSDIEKQKLSQNAELNPLKMELLKARILQAQKSAQGNGELKLSPQERTQAMKLLEAGRSLKTIHEKSTGIGKLLEENPNLTGWIPGAKAAIGKGGEKLSSLIEKAGNLQASIGRLGGQRGGAQVLKWAEKIKPSQWKDVASNKGMVGSILEDTMNDFNEAKNEYETLTGKPYPIQLGQQVGGSSTSKVKRMYKGGQAYDIPENEAADAEKEGFSYAK